MSKIKGKMCWIASDVMTRLFDGEDPDTDVNYLLREVLHLEHPAERVKRKVEPKQPDYKYDVTQLAVGETKLFGFEHSNTRGFYYVTQSIKKYGKKTGKTFGFNASATGLQVVRIL